jgi:hypothetical protein
MCVPGSAAAVRREQLYTDYGRSSDLHNGSDLNGLAGLVDLIERSIVHKITQEPRSARIFAAACLTVHIRTGHPGKHGLGLQPDQESLL